MLNSKLNLQKSVAGLRWLEEKM